jgi:hypothetical protein
VYADDFSVATKENGNYSKGRILDQSGLDRNRNDSNFMNREKKRRKDEERGKKESPFS